MTSTKKHSVSSSGEDFFLLTFCSVLADFTFTFTFTFTFFSVLPESESAPSPKNVASTLPDSSFGQPRLFPGTCYAVYILLDLIETLYIM